MFRVTLHKMTPAKIKRSIRNQSLKDARDLASQIYTYKCEVKDRLVALMLSENISEDVIKKILVISGFHPTPEMRKLLKRMAISFHRQHKAKIANIAPDYKRVPFDDFNKFSAGIIVIDYCSHIVCHCIAFVRSLRNHGYTEEEIQTFFKSF